MAWLWQLLSVAAVLSLSACLPSTDSTLSPEFELLTEASGLERLNPPGVGSGEATFTLELKVLNLNPFALRFAGINGAFFINGQRVAAGLFEANARVDAEASQTVSLDIAVPVEDNLLDILNALIAGEPVDYQLVGQPTLNYFGLEQRLPEMEVFAATWTQQITPLAPTLIFNSGASLVSELSAERAVIDVAFIVENPGLLGYRFVVPDLELSLNGEPVGERAVLASDLEAFGELRTTVHFTLDPSSLDIITSNELRRLSASGASVPVSVSGSLRLELPGLRSEMLPEAVLSSGFLQ